MSYYKVFKVFLWCSIIFLTMPYNIHANELSFAWYPAPHEEGPMGFYILWGPNSGEYHHVWDCGEGVVYGELVKCTITIPEGSTGDYPSKYFTIVAYIKDLETDRPATEIRYDGTTLIYPKKIEDLTRNTVTGEK